MSVPSRVPRALRPLTAALLAAAFVMIAGGSAQASAYRFWGYYPLVNGEWTFATTGPDQTTPADGAVEGWRYALAGLEDPRFPRATPTFDDICAATPAAEGMKRVGVLVDSGRPADAGDGATPPEPRTACAVVPTDASGSAVLAAVAQTRIDGGLTCGIDGYPATGCSEEVATPPPAAAAPDEAVTPSPATAATPATTGTGDSEHSEHSTDASQQADQGVQWSMWLLIGLVLLAVVLAAAISLRRRRRTPDRG